MMAPVKTGPPPAKQDPPASGRSSRLRRLGGAAWSRKWLISLVVLVLAVGAWRGPALVRGTAVTVDRVGRAALVETVVATGNVASPFRVAIASQITGTVNEVNVDEGQKVAKGQTLVTLDTRELKGDVAQAEGAVAQAEAHMRQLGELTLPTARETLAQGRATLLNARQTLGRTATLAGQGYATRAALDAAQKDADVARTEVRMAESQVFTASPGGSDFVTGETMLAQARAALATATSRLDYATITAPRAGVLITRNVERGTVVQAGTMLIVLAPDGQTQLLLAIDERNLGKLALAEKALASADAYPDKKFSAVVSYINPSVDITRASVEVKLDVADPPAYLVQDMTVSVDIEVARNETALVLPVGSVHDALSTAPWVMGVRDGRAYKQPVHLGLQGNTRVEILDGMADGAVAIPVAAVILIGQRVRPITATAGP